MSKSFVLVFAAGTAESNRQIALKFAPHHRIGFICSPQHDLGPAISAAYETGSEAILLETDMSSVDSLKSSIGLAVAEYGKQCAAAIFQVTTETPDVKVPFLEQTAAQFRAETSSQIESAYAFSQAAIPLLTHGVGSTEFPATLVFVGPAKASTSSKVMDNALVALSRSLGREYGKRYIHVAHLRFNSVHSRENVAHDDEAQGERIAETLLHLHMQPLSCFANEVSI
ncbi:hypothetical protein NLG97_g1222 [Lecanicillium saksenae]|uniref:Uncharacterized protein n=1 Tax=Lecanicillium saksenae TaxID=468837 RepID=A0ACC1R4C6_9HYPO|nr:hypothetical protein NLG97_g1222 [Lecanicillium saksenae]